MSNHPTEPAVTNRLAGESSPYLLLHQHNPVDWYPWGEEALRRASREDKPIFLSVGYSTCYWCHVMERESFADPRVAAVMNRDFVNIKLDREERPDLDEVYMTATQILTGQGGWPNSLFLTPKLEPFFAGTYFPPDDAHGRPGFRHVLEDLAQAWKERRTDVEEQAAEMAKAMRHFLEERSRPGAEPPGPGTCWRGVDSLARRFDREWGGFGSAPKFPTPSNLFLLLEMAPERPDAGEMLAATLDAMARGGIYDQLAGGFHRYATDREWKVPHFEKMLYDNGFLLELHAREHARTGDPQAARVARETAAFLGREMTSPEGALWSAIDAETGGHEGAYYVWTRAEIAAVLGEEDAAFAAPLLGFAGPPFFEGDRYVLHAPERWEEVARRRRLDPDELLRELAGPRRRLLEARGKRPRPATDDKVLADWNGMAIAGLAAAGRLLGEPGFIAQAVRAAEVVLGEMRPGGAGGSLMHVWRAGHARIPAFLADYAFLVRGLLALHEATGEARWLASAAELTDEQAARLADPEGGFFVAGASPDLLFRSKDPFDGATPAANAVAVLNLIELAERDAGGRREHWRHQATAALKAFAPLVEQHPEAVRMMAIAARRYRGEVPAPVEAARERAPEAGPLAMLEKEAEELVKVRLEVGEEGGGGKESPAPAGEAAEGVGADVSWRPFRLVLEVAPGWHLQANPPSESFLVPTTLAAEGAELRRVSYPAGEPLRVAFSSRPVAAYQGRVELLGEVGLAAGRQNSPAPGAAHLRLTYQLCDDRRCLPPVTRSVLPS
ncbi:MAG TPA: DUF255 domain-containing protein [Thermoanaerobaculia bacterium]|nr:DUF255 domain-containing protein [Thermoanaerobaculia bacterium]